MRDSLIIARIPGKKRRSSAVTARNNFSARVYLFASLLFLTFAGHPLLAEVIYLKSGETLVGRVVGQNRTELRVQTSGGVKTIARTNIRRVSYSKADEDAELERRADAAAAEAARKQAEERARQEAARKAQKEMETMESEDRPVSPGGLVLRSAVLSGLGHISMDKTFTGAAYMGLSALALGNLISSRSRALAAENQNSNDVLLNLAITFVPSGLETTQRLGANFYLNSAAQEPYKSAVNRYTQSIQLFVGIYLIQLAHIIYDAFAQPAASPADTAENQNAGWNFFLVPTASPAARIDNAPAYAGQIQYTFRF